MHRLAIGLTTLLAALLVVSQLALSPYLENRVANRLTEHGGTADVQLAGVPAARLLFGNGRKLQIRARALSVDLEKGQKDAFTQLDGFRDVTIAVSGSRAGPFRIRSFTVQGTGDHSYHVTVGGGATAGDVTSYAAQQLAGGFGRALAALAAGVLGDSEGAIPFNATMQIDTSGGQVQADDVVGSVAGFPAGPLAQVVANALLGAL